MVDRRALVIQEPFAGSQRQRLGRDVSSGVPAHHSAIGPAFGQADHGVGVDLGSHGHDFPPVCKGNRHLESPASPVAVGKGRPDLCARRLGSHAEG